MQQQEELELIRRIVNGETDLYAILARRYGRVVYTLVSRIVGCAEDAEELAQDVFLKAFRNLHRFNGRSSFPTWLFRIAYNTAVSETRRRKREWACIDQARLANLPDSEAERMDAWEGRQEYLDALGTRHALLLRRVLRKRMRRDHADVGVQHQSTAPPHPQKTVYTGKYATAWKRKIT